jgi:hypothetical protein
MRSNVLDLLIAIGKAKAVNGNIIDLIEKWTAANDVDLNQLGRRARRSFHNRLQAAALALAQSIERGCAIVGEAPTKDLDFTKPPSFEQEKI